MFVSKNYSALVCGVLLCALVLISATTKAGDNIWTFDGPEGGSAIWIGQSPLDDTVRLAISEHRLYRWVEDQQRWQATREAVGDVVFSTQDAQTAIAIGASPNLLKTTDGGITFTTIVTGLPAGPIKLIGDPDGRLYVSTFNLGVWTSDDEGLSWQPAQNGWPTAVDNPNNFFRPRDIATAPSRPQRVYASIIGNGFVASDDAGATWTAPANAGFPASSFFSPLLVDPLDPDHVWVGSGTAETFDGGESWSAIPALPGIASFSANPANPATIYALANVGGDVFRSTDSGQTWSVQGSVPASQTFGFDFGNLSPGSNGQVLAATGEGIYAQSAANLPFESLNSGFASTLGEDLVQNAATGRFYLNGTAVVTSNDHGDSWQRLGGGLINQNGIALEYINAVAVAPDDDQVIYAGGRGPEIYRSDNGGQSWAVVGSLGLTHDVSALSVAPTMANRIYAGTFNGSSWRSDDSGTTWQLLATNADNGWVTDIAVNPSDSDTLLLSVFAGGLFFSDNAGDSWTQALGGTQGTSARAIRYSERVAGQVRVSTNRAGRYTPWLSNDDGRTWTQVTEFGNFAVYSVNEHPDVDDVLYISMDFGMRRSLDNGATLELIAEQTPVGIPFPLHTPADGVFVDRKDPSRLFSFEFRTGVGRYTVARNLALQAIPLTPTATLVDTLSYELTVDNDDTGLAGRVRVDIPQPTNGQITSATAAGAECALADGGAVCLIAQLAAPESLTLTVDVTPVWLGDVILEASVSSIEKELSPENNTVTATATVVSADVDDDSIEDALDNCALVFNPDQRDTNSDDFGNACDADLNNDGVVNVADLGLLRSVFFSSDADADFNGDGTVSVFDLGIMRASFFGAPGPSGLVGLR
ncbi:MAG: hypothetical protein AB8G16_08325 [Gammaproteobacteria bacterium]